ncbi:MAG: histidine kinase [Gemmatimonadales bacterium]|nr:histidine kinase [Gemmatimonadales bacterium]
MGGLSLARIGALSVGFWTVSWLGLTLARVSDRVRQGQPAALGESLLDNGLAMLPWVGLMPALYLAFHRRRHRLLHPPTVAAIFAATVLGFLLPYFVYLATIEAIRSGASLTAVPGILAGWTALYWFFDVIQLTAVFAGVYAVVAVQSHLATERQREAAERENLTLRLDLERHRLAALRGQLEPHFLFNALNAIAGLVRSGDQRVAVAGVNRLSELLRYALTATEREWVTIEDELVFLRSYLALQTLRFGSRLEATIDDVDSSLHSVDCLPLLLQPLVENAIRHDLSHHEEATWIRIALRREGSDVVITVRNSIRPGTTPTPGLGLGLATTRARLAQAYGERAVLEVENGAGEFIATVRQPMERSE